MFDNYARLARDDVFWKALWNTVLFMVVTVNLSLAIGFGLAMMLARMTFAVGPARTLLMIPMMFAPVLIGFQFSWFFNATVGLVNNALLTLGRHRGSPSPGWSPSRTGWSRSCSRPSG